MPRKGPHFPLLCIVPRLTLCIGKEGIQKLWGSHSPDFSSFCGLSLLHLFLSPPLIAAAHFNSFSNAFPFRAQQCLHPARSAAQLLLCLLLIHSNASWLQDSFVSRKVHFRAWKKGLLLEGGLTSKPDSPPERKGSESGSKRQMKADPWTICSGTANQYFNT